jgi:CO/xanthine dehydrogenase FAD-binding subunit
LLTQVLRTIHSWQIRAETTVGRTLRVSQLMPHWVAALLGLGAVVSVENGEGVNEVDLEALINRQVSGDVKELYVSRQADVHWGEASVARTPSDDPIITALAVLRSRDDVVEEARLLLTGVSSRPVWISDALTMLVGQALSRGPTSSPGWIDDVASAVEEEVEPVGDYLGSQAYRRAMAKVLTRRALEACLAERSPGGGR